MKACIDPGQLARAYGVSLYDYEREGAGLGIVNGTGALLVLMDARPDLRWALSIEGVRQPTYALAAFLEAVACLDVPVAAYMVFLGVTSPDAACTLLAPFAGRLDYHANVELPGRGVSLSELLREGELA